MVAGGKGPGSFLPTPLKGSVGGNPVAASPPTFNLSGALYLRGIRSFLKRSHALPLAAFFAVVYTLGSMLWGGMLSLVPLRGGTTVEILTGSGTGQGWWNYPGLLVVAPWGSSAFRSSRRSRWSSSPWGSGSGWPSRRC